MDRTKIRARISLLALAMVLSACSHIPPPKTPPQCDAKFAGVLMTFAALAYVDEEVSGVTYADLTKELDSGKLAANSDWRVVWGPANHGGNLAYVVRDTTNKTLAVVLRGSDFDFVTNYIEDVNFRQRQPALFPSNSKAKVSVGIHLALKHVTEMKGDVRGAARSSARSSAGTQSLLDEFVVEQVSSGAVNEVWVTGHSLGGGLTTVVLPWLKHALAECKDCNGVTLNGYSFAGQTAGNPAFADEFSAAFPNFCRVVNPLDVVPQGYSSLAGIIEHDIPTDVPFLDPPIGEVILGLDAALLLKGWKYDQVENEMVLCGVRLTEGTWLEQVASQHNHNCYLEMLGAPQAMSSGAACAFSAKAVTQCEKAHE